ncbi:MAG: hypothetical protein HW403_206 [Dehalococcoidia bacterium]|nr:hypothetical protein [Dehalococcoidia bacterium]
MGAGTRLNRAPCVSPDSCRPSAVLVRVERGEERCGGMDAVLRLSLSVLLLLPLLDWGLDLLAIIMPPNSTLLLL